MPKIFDIPTDYRSELVGGIKRRRSENDPRKQNMSPTSLDFGPVSFKIARFFGFCYGVENAIEIAYRAVEENPDKRVFLLSEMIHNPQVNADLISRGVRFLHTTSGEELVPFSELTPDDVVIVPAFGTTVELFDEMSRRGIEYKKYDATCPFVEKVWNRGESVASSGFTVVIHGKHTHEETRATFSHISRKAPSLVVLNRSETKMLAEFITGERDLSEFPKLFSSRVSKNFDPQQDLQRIAVVNQTTMLAEETKEIAEIIKSALTVRYGRENIKEHFADTRDTLCYATSENQRAMRGLVDSKGDLALVVGGYNSSNTSHLVEICESKVPVYFIKDADELVSLQEIRHLDLASHQILNSKNWFPEKEKVEILLSAGASCPDALVEGVMRRVTNLLGVELKPVISHS